MSDWTCSGRPTRPCRRRVMKSCRVMSRLPQDGLDGAGERTPGVFLRGEAGLAGGREAIVFARRSGGGLDQIGLDQTVGLHPAHQRIDGALAHADRLGEPAGDLVGVAVAPRQQRQNAKIERPFFQLDVDGLGHGLSAIGLAVRLSEYSQLPFYARYLAQHFTELIWLRLRCPARPVRCNAAKTWRRRGETC